VEINVELRDLVLEKLELKWFPEQISVWLKKTAHRRKTMQISAETIY
jgi:IS30 family transposase